MRQAECALLSQEEVEQLCTDVEASDQGSDPHILPLTGLQAYGTQAFEGPLDVFRSRSSSFVLRRQVIRSFS